VKISAGKQDRETRAKKRFWFAYKSWEVTEIARNQIVGTSCVGTLKENIVIGIASHFEAE
jgi:hypothetical protein